MRILIVEDEVRLASTLKDLLEMQIGAPLPDGSGRYVRLAGSSTIYDLPTATLDPLMHISVLGLDG